ncbi:hypothetical protein BpHYR1_003510 [Brachionus plicatilis]|uniref:Uncharacterized protein n=1 Tax=Brachionus plicatilis TaxID=10195 RepID=A0A3M7Q597_BRAPC|nr:hypothetical protein BpHYR1_003510 [Brachionus plicatilis]
MAGFIMLGSWFHGLTGPCGAVPFGSVVLILGNKFDGKRELSDLLLFKPIHHLRDNLYMLKSGLDGAITRDECKQYVALLDSKP